MAEPDKYSRTYSFTDYQSGNPSAPLPGVQVDNELENIEQSLGEAIDAIGDIRRSDGKLNNGVVTVDSLDAQVAAGVGTGALASAAAAAASADAASDSAVASAASATAAAGSATTASGYAGNALTSRNEAETERTLAQTARTGAQTARDYANKWATEAEDVNVDDGVNPVGRSAFHWSQKAAASAASVGLPSSLTANTIPVTNAGATAREDKTFSELRGLLGVDGDVADRTALKALDTAKYAVAYLLEAGREGHFRWTPGDFSAQITADTAEGIYIKADDVASTAGAWVRHGDANVHHFGGSSSADSAAAIAGMTGVVGFVIFPFGSTLVSSDTTIDFPVFFDAGAYITVASTKTVTITNRVESPRQWIFRGAGLYVLGHDSDSGEDARQVHVSWFGAFPSTGTDQSGYIQAACTAMGNLRESVIEFDIGNYVMASGVTTTRGCHIKGQGTRRTVFKVATDGFDVFTTGATAARFTGVQFELDMGAITTRDSAWINIQHDMCEVYDYFSQSAKYGIIVGPAANNTRIRNVIGVYGAAPSAGSSLISVRATNADIADVYCPSSSSIGPTAIIHIGGTGVSGNISDARVNNVKSICPSITVLVDASGGNISRTMLNAIDYSGFAGTAPAQAIKFVTSSTYSITGATIDGFQISGYATAGITLSNGSSSTIKNVTISSGVVSGATGNAIEFIRTAGGITDIRIDASVDVTDRATPFSYSGSGITNIKINPLTKPRANVGEAYYFTGVADDTAISVDLKRSVFTGIIIVTVGTANYGIYAIRAASGPAIQPITVSANMNSVATALTGTTGTDAKVTTGVDANGVIYVENRLGTSQNVSVAVMAV